MNYSLPIGRAGLRSSDVLDEMRPHAAAVERTRILAGMRRKKKAPSAGPLLAGLRDRLGLPHAGPDELLAAVDAKLTAVDELDAAQAAVDAGQLVAVPTAELDRLRELADAPARLAKARREAIVDGAVQAGRIAPATRATWLAQLEQNEGEASALLLTIPENTIPVREIGHSDAPDRATEDAIYRGIYGRKGA